MQPDDESGGQGLIENQAKACLSDGRSGGTRVVHAQAPNAHLTDHAHGAKPEAAKMAAGCERHGEASRRKPAPVRLSERHREARFGAQFQRKSVALERSKQAPAGVGRRRASEGSGGAEPRHDESMFWIGTEWKRDRSWFEARGALARRDRRRPRVPCCRGCCGRVLRGRLVACGGRVEQLNLYGHREDEAADELATIPTR